MQARLSMLAAVLAFGAMPIECEEPAALPPVTGAGIERGVALLRCAAPDSGFSRQSRAAVLDTGAAHADVLLTAAHALPPLANDIERDCRIVVRGKDYVIAAAWMPGGGAAGPEHDWAVLLLAARIKGDLYRFPAAAVPGAWLDELVADNAPVRLVLRYAGTAQTDCRLERWTANRLLGHTCVTYPGESGSPVVVGVDGRLVLIGLHVGSQLHWDGSKLDMVSVARPLDGAILLAVETAAARAAEQTRRRRR